MSSRRSSHTLARRNTVRCTAGRGRADIGASHLKYPSTDFQAPHPPQQTASHVTFAPQTAQLLPSHPTCAAISSTPCSVTARACASAAVNPLPAREAAHDCTSCATSAVPAEMRVRESSRLAGRNTTGKVKGGRRRFVIVTHLLTMAATRKCYGKPVRKSADIQRVRQQGAGTLTPEAMPSPRTRAQAVSGCGGKGHASHHQTPSRGLLLTLPLFLIFTSCSSARAMAHASKIAW